MSTKTEREMLELAAKAAGYDVRFEPGHVIDAEERDKIIAIIYGHDYADDWSPLADDGDALRLAVTLRIEIGFFAGMVYAGPGGNDQILCGLERGPRHAGRHAPRHRKSSRRDRQE